SPRPSHQPQGGLTWTRHLFGVVLVHHLTATVETVRGHVVAQVGFTSGLIYGQCRAGQCIMRTTHATCGTSLLVLLYSHDFKLLSSGIAFQLGQHTKGVGLFSFFLRLRFIRLIAWRVLTCSHRMHRN